MPAPAIFLHGFMGGSLWSRRSGGWASEWWLTLRNALPPAVGHLERRVRLPDGDALQPRYCLTSVGPKVVYAELQAFLRDRGYRWLAYDEAESAAHAPQPPYVVDCVFDWRKGIELAAGRLAALIEDPAHAGLWDGRKPVILAHSQGGLVARHYVERMGGAARVERIVTFGTPHRGMLKTFKGMVDGLTVATISAGRVRRLARTFPASCELLPAPPTLAGSPHLYYDANHQAADPLVDRSWVPASERAALDVLLDDAAPAITGMPRASSVPLDVVVGIGLPTVDHALWRDGALRFRYSRRGDATSPLASQIWPAGANVRRFAIPCGVGGGHEQAYRQRTVEHANLFDDWDARRLIDRALGVAAALERAPVAHISDWRALPGAKISVTVIGQDGAGEELPGFEHRVLFMDQPIDSFPVDGVPGAYQTTFRMPEPQRYYKVEVRAHWDGWSEPRLILKRRILPVAMGRMLTFEEAERSGFTFAPTDGERLMLSLL